ncbi:helix-turn-helix transcriptional regulator [Castellaniella sp.]|uniref:helix-turn-helix transcriptional regulator n=1 Tax=Castellaniella sp. TaxID=1955812 RepID=UPI003A913FEA
MIQHPRSTLLRRQEVEEILNLSRASIYARLNPKDKGYDPAFPVPIKVGANAVRWSMPEIDAYIASLPRSREVAAIGEALS